MPTDSADTPRADHEFKGDGPFCQQPCLRARSSHPCPEPAEREQHIHSDDCDCYTPSRHIEGFYEPDAAGDPLGEMAIATAIEALQCEADWETNDQVCAADMVPVLRAAFERLVRECADVALKAPFLTADSPEARWGKECGSAILARYGLTRRER